MKRKSKKKLLKPGRPTKPVAKANLLKVATKLFAEHGYKGVTIREIASKAKVNTANISYHFGSKFGLYEAIIEEQVLKRKKDLEANRNGECSPKEKIIKRALLIMKTAEAEKDFYNLIYRILLCERDPKVKRVIQKKYLVPLTKDLFDLFEQGKKTEMFKFLSKEKMAMMSVSVQVFWFLFADAFAPACPAHDTGQEVKDDAVDIVKQVLNKALK